MSVFISRTVIGRADNLYTFVPRRLIFPNTPRVCHANARSGTRPTRNVYARPAHAERAVYALPKRLIADDSKRQNRLGETSIRAP